MLIGLLSISTGSSIATIQMILANFEKKKHHLFKPQPTNNNKVLSIQWWQDHCMMLFDNIKIIFEADLIV